MRDLLARLAVIIDDALPAGSRRAAARLNPREHQGVYHGRAPGGRL